MYSTPSITSAAIKSKFLDAGFSGVGIAKAEFLEPEAKRLEEWLGMGFQGEMSYLENYFDLRTDPRLLVPGAKSVITLLYNYYPNETLAPDSYKIARFAYGKDYHKVIKKKLKTLILELQLEIGTFNHRYFVDSAPVLERDWARRSGLGWVGKNTLLIHPRKGSYFFIASIICDLDLIYDQPIKDYCGTCRKCIEACPTDAFSEHGYVLDGSKCISYLTIELKNDLPEEFKGKMADFIFGCDICQEVCPWNRFSEPHKEEAFEPNLDLTKMRKDDWEELTEPIFEQLFSGSAVKRTKFEGLKRNIEFVKKTVKE